MKAHFLKVILIVCQCFITTALIAIPNISVTADAERRLRACPSAAYYLENSSLDADKAVVTMFDNFMTGLKASGLTDGEARHVLNGVVVTMKIAHSQNDPYLLPAVHFINRNGGTSPANSKLMVCVLPVGCHLNAEVFGASSSTSAYVMGRRSDADPENDISKDNGISLSREELMVIKPYRLATETATPNYLEGVTRISNWYGQFFRDVTQSTVLDIMDRWVQANSRLIAAGAQSDSFYQQYKNSESERSTLYYILNFATSHAAGFAARRNYINEVISSGAEALVAETEANARRVAMKDIRRLAGEDAPMRYGLTEQNVFEMGARLREMMETTIRSAPP